MKNLVKLFAVTAAISATVMGEESTKNQEKAYMEKYAEAIRQQTAERTEILNHSPLTTQAVNAMVERQRNAIIRLQQEYGAKAR